MLAPKLVPLLAPPVPRVLGSVEPPIAPETAAEPGPPPTPLGVVLIPPWFGVMTVVVLVPYPYDP
jgi:hypothetical protein